MQRDGRLMAPATGRVVMGLSTFFAAVLAAAALTAATGPATAFNGEADGAGTQPPPTPSLAEVVNERFGVRASSLLRLEVEGRPGVAFRQVLQIGGRQVTLDVRPHSVRTEGYQVYVYGADGVLARVAPGPVNTFRGTVLEDRGSVVAGSVIDGAIDGRVILSDGREFWFEPVARNVPGADEGLYVVYSSDDILPRDGICGTPDEVRRGLPVVGDDDPLSGGGGVMVAELGADADFEYFSRWGGNTAARVNAIVAQANIQYERDVDIEHEISALIIRESRVYTSTDSFGLLSQFRTRWIQNHRDIQRDVAHLFTGKNIDGNVIGRAWSIPGPICSNNGAYCFAQSDCCGGIGCAGDLTAHELGHLWGAFHCNPCSTTMRSFIGCFQRFGSASQNSIGAHRDSRDCLRSRRPENDDCADATPVSDGSHEFRTTDATTDGPNFPPECDEGGGTSFKKDVWFVYTATCDGIATAGVCNADYDTRLAVYDTSDCPGGIIACSDDACGTDGTRSETSFPVTAGTRYLVRIGGRFVTGGGSLELSCTDQLPCPEDLDGNGLVGFSDVLEVLGNWGGGGPEGDANEDGIVDFQDLLAILAAWGPCP